MAEFSGTPVFQFQPETVGGGSVGASGAGPRLGITGGQSQAGVKMFADTTNIGAGSPLPEFLAQAFAPKLEAVKQQKMWDGFAAARSGMTQQEIHDEQPWYSKIFGSTSYELGAETYGVQKAAADMETQFLKRMPELQQMDQEEVARELNTMATSLQTGNLYTDAILQKSMMERSGPMLQAHGKARELYQQTTLAHAQNQSWMSSGGAYQEAQAAMASLGTNYPGQEVAAEQMRERKILLLQNFGMAEGQTYESYMKNLQVSAAQMARDGQWHTLAALEESGLLDQMDPDTREKFDARMETASNKFKRRMSADPAIYEPIAKINAAVAVGAMSAENGVAALADLDAQFRAVTGNQRGLFENADYQAIGEKGSSAYYRMWARNEDKLDRIGERNADRAATEEAKAQAEARGAAQLALATTTNALGAMNVDYSMKDNAFMQQANDRPDLLPMIAVGNMMATGADKEPFVSKRMQAKLQGQVRDTAGEAYTDGFGETYQTWQAIRYHQVVTNDDGVDTVSGNAAAIEYYGDFADEMQAFHDQIVAGVPPEAAYRRVLGNQVSFGHGELTGRDAEDTKEMRDAMHKVVIDESPSWYVLGSDAMGHSANNLVLDAVTRAATRLRRNDSSATPKDLARGAMAMAKANGLEISGRYAWQNMAGQLPLHKWADMDRGVFEDHFTDVIDGKMRRQGMAPSKKTSVSLVRLGDDAFGPRIAAMVYKDDGSMMHFAITGQDIKTIRDRKLKSDIERRNQPTLGEGGIYDPTTSPGLFDTR